MSNAHRDQNRTTTITGVSSADGITPTEIWVDPITHRALVDNANTSASLTVGTTAITGGTTTRILYDNAGTLGEYTVSGTGSVAMTASPAFTTPNIGSATGSVSGNAGTATALATGRTVSITGDLAYTSPSFDGSGNVTAAGTLATVNSNVGTFGSATQASQVTVNGKGLVTAASGVTVTPAVGSITGLGTNVGTFLATPSSANLAAALTDETGTGAAVFGTNPTIVKPVMNARNQTAQSYSPAGAGTATLDLSLADQHDIIMPAGNITIALSNDTNNQIFSVSILQDGTGSRTVTWFNTIRWAGGSPPTLTTTASKRDRFVFIRTGSGTYDGLVAGQNI